MSENSYPDPKPGGWVSTEAGNEAVIEIDDSDAYWLAPERAASRPSTAMSATG